MDTTLTSVWEKTDAAFLSQAIPFYFGCEPKRILDATLGLGVFWKNTAYGPIGLDNDLQKHPAILGDNRALPFANEVFDVIVYDPPHVTHSWSPWDSSSRYSVADGRGSIAYLYPAFLAEAHRTLNCRGILMGKIADQIHSGRQWLQSIEFITKAQCSGFTVCDLIVKVRQRYRPQPEGRGTRHARRRHSFWIICRKGEDC